MQILGIDIGTISALICEDGKIPKSDTVESDVFISSQHKSSNCPSSSKKETAFGAAKYAGC